jgi:hypothetical protein
LIVCKFFQENHRDFEFISRTLNQRFFLKKFSESSDFEIIKECKPDLDNFQRTKTRGSWISKISKTQNQGLLIKSKNHHPAQISTNVVCVWHHALGGY